MNVRTIRYFPAVHMANSHDGLKQIAKKEKIDLDALAPGELVIFTNAPFTALKLYASGHVYAYYRAPRGRLNALMISKIPASFGGGKLIFDAALKDALIETLEKAKK